MIRSENTGLSSERLGRIRPTVEKHLGDEKIAGAVMLVARREELFIWKVRDLPLYG